MSASKDKILIATAKGLVVYEFHSGQWTYRKTHFLGQPASMVFFDKRNGAWWVSLAHRHWGQKMHCSENEGKTWIEVATPQYPEGSELSPGVPATLKYIWSITGGGMKHPERIWVGTEPGGLFLSKDNGGSFTMIETLWEHPTRPEFWFGGGRDNAGIHSIVVDPRDDDHVYIGVSCAGVFETMDAGKIWEMRNDGLRADYLPDPLSKAGHDPHAIKICQSEPSIIWQQNHCGIFRSLDSGKTWLDVTDKNGLAKYGFALAIDDEAPNRAWVVPAVSDQTRVAVDQSLCICRTDDGGKTWQEYRRGLPQGNCFDIVLRHDFDKCDDTLVFGTNTGNLFISNDAGESWGNLNNYLPTVFALCFA